MSAEAGGGVEVGAYPGGLSSTERSGARRGLQPIGRKGRLYYGELERQFSTSSVSGYPRRDLSFHLGIAELLFRV